MTDMMMNLSVGHFHAGEMIVQELDTCEEMLFICEGKYDVGYMVNKKAYWRAKFGPSTIIGIFQMCFGKRYNFFYNATTDMMVYNLSKRTFHRMGQDFPKFLRSLKQKSFTWYYRNIYQPLMTKKKKDIKKLEVRQDYN